MEASKLLVDLVVYAMFFLSLKAYVTGYKSEKQVALKACAVVCFSVTTLLMWIYTYAIIGYAVDELIGGV